MAIHPTLQSPVRAPFIRPEFSLSGEKAPITSLPDLVEFNALHNPSHLFCLQYGRNTEEAPRRISFESLHHGVLWCCAWLAENQLAQGPRATKPRPVAILMSSDIGWFFMFIALLRLGIPVLCLSTRLAPPAVLHLVRSTGTQAILISSPLEALAQEAIALLAAEDNVRDVPTLHSVPSYSDFLDIRSALDPAHVPPPLQHEDRPKDAVILHSSGSTGLPKPITHSHAYLLGYAACHQLSSEDVEGSMNVSTLPLFHGFGQLAPSLALSVGMPFALPAASTIPTGPVTMAMLRTSGATSLMTVPSILEELYLLGDATALDTLRKLRFVAVGGAPMKHSVAEPLANAGVPILNHWGATEIGAIAPIFVPKADYDWRYLRVRDDLGLRFEPVEGDAAHFRLVGCPPGTQQAPFVVQDLLEVNPLRPTSEFRIAGRADDLIVLATGEKVRPTQLEQHVAEDVRVRGAVAFGDARFQLGLLVEAAPQCALDVHDALAVEAYIDAIWPAVERGNAETDRHGRVAREMVLVTTPDSVPLVRTPKGNAPRAANVELFKERIDALYAKADVAGAEPLPIADADRLRDAVRELVIASFASPRSIADTDDFFERGMDSLQATTLLRRLSSGLAAASPDSPPLPRDIIYANPSVTLLCAALQAHQHQYQEPARDRLAEIRATMEEYVAKVNALADEIAPSPVEPPSSSSSSSSHPTNQPIVVLLTGSTGSLGSALLDVLASSPNITKIQALNRPSPGPLTLRSRQESGLQKLGIDPESWAYWDKVVLHTADLGKVRFGMDEEGYAGLGGVTHVVHNAWPMDFNRSLTSFRPHLDAALNVIRLALSNPHRVRVLFSSSIAVVGRYPLLHPSPSPSSSTSTSSSTATSSLTPTPVPVPEQTLDDPAALAHFGYAEAKWVCERMFEAANHLNLNLTSNNDRGGGWGGVEAQSVRIGQMVAARGRGEWNVGEHVPMIMKSCVAVGKMPKLEGTVSWIPVDEAALVMSEFLFAEYAPAAAEPRAANTWWTVLRSPFSSLLSAITSRSPTPSTPTSSANSPAFPPILHLENPTRHPWSTILTLFASSLSLSPSPSTSSSSPSSLYIPLAEWLSLVQSLGDTPTNPASKLVPFLEGEFERLATGGVVLGMERGRGVSGVLDAMGREAQTEEEIEGEVRRVVRAWREEGFL
ncbi:acetyl-CoA synthetase-like protein [Trametopsis cervina]|nr:acetyl-CoA synthetase-like protein [Trametopsis cervina]